MSVAIGDLFLLQHVCRAEEDSKESVSAEDGGNTDTNDSPALDSSHANGKSKPAALLSCSSRNAIGLAPSVTRRRYGQQSMANRTGRHSFARAASRRRGGAIPAFTGDAGRASGVDDSDANAVAALSPRGSAVPLSRATSAAVTS